MTSRFVLLRFWLGRKFIKLGLWALPPSEYRRELSAMIWTLGLRVQATVAASRAASMQNEVHEQIVATLNAQGRTAAIEQYLAISGCSQIEAGIYVDGIIHQDDE